MPDDEEHDEFGQPLPPDDRLWRHPSELGSEGGRQQIVLVSQTVGLGRTVLVGMLAALVGAAAVVGVGFGAGWFDEVTPGRNSTEVVAVEANATPGESDLAIAEKVLPSVATVLATGPDGTTVGSGVVFRADTAGGHLITTAGVIDGAESLAVVLNDGTKALASLVGRSVSTDIAVIAVDQPNLTVAPRAAQRARFGLHTVIIDAGSQTRAPEISVGFVTVASREVDLDDAQTMYGMVEVTTRANVGQLTAGTVLIDERGTVVGIISGRAEEVAAPSGTAKAVPTRAADDENVPANAYHLAIGAELLWDIAGQIVDTGGVVHAEGGFHGVALSPEEAKAYGVPGGVRLDQPRSGTGAAAAGLRANDIVIGIEDSLVTSRNDVEVEVRKHRPGSELMVTYLRNGDRWYDPVRLDGRPELP